MNKILPALLAFGLILVSSCPVIAAAPPAIRESVAVCDVNNPSHCLTPGGGGGLQVGDFKNLPTSVKTRIANTTPYTATSTTPQAVCLFTSTTACAPQTMTVSSTVTVHGTITGLSLVKSTTGNTGATFRVYAFQGTPTLTGIFDASPYSPSLADVSSSAYIGSWDCNTEIINGDNARYNCTSPTNDGHEAFQLINGTLSFVLTTTGLYVPGSGETFYIAANLATTVP